MFYDANRISGLGSINVEPDARFCHEHAAMQAVIESQQNELIMFENNLAVDFQEAAMIHEGGDIEALHENVFTDIFKRIKDLFMKLWAKIKSIFKVFIAKFDSIFMKSSKEFIKKYKKDVLKKDLTDVTINYSKPKGVDFVINSALTVSISKAQYDRDFATHSTALAMKKDLEDYDAEKQEEEYIADLTGLRNTTLADFDKEYHEHCYEDESKEDLTTSLLSEAIATLEGSDDILKKVKKANDILNKAVANIIKEIDKEQSAFAKKKSTEGSKIQTKFTVNAGEKEVNAKRGIVLPDSVSDEVKRNAKEAQQAVLSLLSKKATCLQSCVTKVTAGTIREAKFGASQARRVIVKALGAKGYNGESALLDAIEESAAYEAELELR